MHADVVVRPGRDEDVPALVDLSLRAWEPVFASVRDVLGARTFDQLWPDWRTAQSEVVGRCCRDEDSDLLVAELDEAVVGLVITTRRTEDAAQIGEVDLLAVDPAVQGRGIAGVLLERGLEAIRGYGVDLAVVATGGDAGHAPARAVYERAGFHAFPQVRLYRRLDQDGEAGLARGADRPHGR